MKQTGFDRARDQRVADEVSHDAAIDRASMCAAHGCPNRWGVDRGDGRLCSAHAWAARHHWPQVTDEQIDASARRAAALASTTHGSGRRDPARLAAALEPLRRPTDPKAWIGRLKARLDAGERLTVTQREMLQTALSHNAIGRSGVDRDELLREEDAISRRVELQP